jgi:hypothetical protein
MNFKGHALDTEAAGIVECNYVPETHKLDLRSPDRILMAKEDSARALYCALVRELADALEELSNGFM